MSYHFEKTIVDAKDIYTDYLLYVLTPLIYEGLLSIYDYSYEKEQNIIELEKNNPKLKNPGIAILFQHFLSSIEKWTDSLIESETQRIIDNSKCSDIFDDLVKAVIKSHITVLTYSLKDKTQIIEAKLHENVDIKTFIHKCYLECSRIFYDHPLLFWHKFPNHERKENQTKIYYLIKIGIKNGIKKSLPMKSILNLYLNNDHYDSQDDLNNEKYLNVKQLLEQENNSEMNGGDVKILDSDDTYNPNDFNNNLINDDVNDNIEFDIYDNDLHDNLIKRPNMNDEISKLIYGKNDLETVNDTFNHSNSIIEQKISSHNSSHQSNHNENNENNNEDKYDNHNEFKIKEVEEVEEQNQVTNPDPYEMLKQMKKQSNDEVLTKAIESSNKLKIRKMSNNDDTNPIFIE